MIPAVDFGGSGPQLTFLHANGYPPGCYRPLLADLAELYDVTAMLQRPLWDGSGPEDLKDWALLSTDLLKFLDETQTAPALVVGHSLGAIVALRAAIRRPAEFRALVLIEPVLFPPTSIMQAAWLRLIGQGERHPLIVASRKRRQTFDDLERLLASYRQRSVFRYMDDNALRIYVSSMTCPNGNGMYRLCYSAPWETRIYLTGLGRGLDLWRGLHRLRVPTLILRGAETDTFWVSTARRVHRINPAIQITTFAQTTHLLPMEKPHDTASAIQEFFSPVLTAA